MVVFDLFDLGEVGEGGNVEILLEGFGMGCGGRVGDGVTVGRGTHIMGGGFGERHGSGLGVIGVVGGLDRVGAVTGDPGHACYHFAIGESAGLVGADV